MSLVVLSLILYFFDCPLRALETVETDRFKCFEMLTSVESVGFLMPTVKMVLYRNVS